MQYFYKMIGIKLISTTGLKSKKIFLPPQLNFLRKIILKKKIFSSIRHICCSDFQLSTCINLYKKGIKHVNFVKGCRKWITLSMSLQP